MATEVVSNVAPTSLDIEAILQGDAALAGVRPVDLTQRVVYFPVRHHSPACAWHVGRLIRALRPNAVLIEGPRDATPLVPLLVHAETQMPVAIYATYVRRVKAELPERHAAYYPLCGYSPELEAVRAGLEVGAQVKFIDLTFPEKVEAGAASESVDAVAAERAAAPTAITRTGSLQDESWFSHSRLLRAACVRTGARDHDDLWDHLYEVDYQYVCTDQFIRNVLLYCALARRDSTREQLAADGCLAREQAMAAAISEERERVVVVTGGFHTVALPETTPAWPANRKISPDDRQVVLMRYSFEQLDRLNGYASGMPSPEFYQRDWEERDASEMLVEIGRECRRKNLGQSTADAIAAVGHSRRLAHLRGHVRPSREDVLDAIRSVYIKGADDAEGVPVLAIARKWLAGDRVGNVPLEAGQPPIVHDFRNTATQLRLKLDKADETESILDLYRKSNHREVSRMFHRLAFIGVPFAKFVRGPDFVAGENLERIQEVWRYAWSPQTESTLIERSLYGSTMEEAATGMLLERFQVAEAAGQGRSAAVATQLVIHACRMGLHRHTGDLLRRVAGLLTDDAAFDSLVTAMENLLALEVSREPLEAHHLTGLSELAMAAYRRACFLIPGLVNTPVEEESKTLEGLNALVQGGRSLGDGPELRTLRSEALAALAGTTGGSAVVRGGAVGALFGDGCWDGDQVVAALRGHLLSSRDGGIEGPHFLRGLLLTARGILWSVEGILDGVSLVLGTWDEDQFIRLLPLLRLALSDLTPRETDRIARMIAARVGAKSLNIEAISDVDSLQMLRGVALNKRVRDSLIADGLEAFSE